VLNVVRNEKLMDNAVLVGSYLFKHLCALRDDFEFVGDIRGMGLFLGLDIVHDKKSKSPWSDMAYKIIGVMRERRILLSVDGPHRNVIKIKPPIVFNLDNAGRLLSELRVVLDEISKASKL
jgi:ethanolamine-phosphate phospho-lyase